MMHCPDYRRNLTGAPGRLVLCALMALLGLATTAEWSPVSAQEVIVRPNVGVAVPLGSAGEVRSLGPMTALALETRFGRWGLRLDGEWALLDGTPAPPGQEIFTEYQDLRSIGGSLNLVRTFSEGDLAAYGLVGGGAYRLQRTDAPPSVYGTTRAVQMGLGVESDHWDRIRPFMEGRLLVHLTDYGGRQYGFTVVAPVGVGLRVHLGPARP